MKPALRISRRLPLLSAFTAAALMLSAQQPTDADLGRMVKLEGIEVKGSRIPAPSFSAISGLRIGTEVNDAIVRKACGRIQSTGLFKSVDYLYNLYPDRPAVTLTLTVVDEGPLLPATIQPASDEAPLWSALQAMSPIFTKNLPPTEKALRFYAINLEKCLKQQGRSDEYIAPSVIGDANNSPTAIQFQVKKYKGLPGKK
jgi:hypothetical protein